MNDAKCNFCGQSFRNRQAVRAHLRHCPVYRRRQGRTKPAREGLPRRSLPIGRLVPEADEIQVEFDPIDNSPAAAPEPQVQPPQTGAAELRALLEAGEKRRKEQAVEARKLRRRQIIQRVKDRVVGQFGSPGSIPAETKALALKEIERELSVLPLDELPEWELVQIAEGARDRVYGPVMRAHDEAQRLEEQRRREEQEAARRAVEQRSRAAHERQEREEHIAALRRYGMALARDAVQHVENLDQGERRSLLQRVEQELAELTGEASERDVAARVGEILDAELGELEADDEDDGYDDEYEEEDDEDGDEDDEDNDDEDEDDE